MEEITDKCFKGQVKVTASKRQVQIWVNDEDKCIFRFKFIGDVHGSQNEFVVIGKKEVQ